MKAVKMLLLSFLVLLAGCGSGPSGEQDAKTQNDAASSRAHEQMNKNPSAAHDMTIDLAASEKTLPADFNERAFKREEVPLYEYFVKKAGNQSDYDDVWALYELEDKPPHIDFSENDALFIGLYESGEGEGNCPKMPGDVRLNTDGQSMTVALDTITGPNDNCEEMATPRTHVLKVPKDASRAISHITIIETYDDTAIETEVPIET